MHSNSGYLTHHALKVTDMTYRTKLIEVALPLEVVNCNLRELWERGEEF